MRRKVTIIGPCGVKGRIPAKLTGVERLTFQANALKEVIRNLEI